MTADLDRLASRLLDLAARMPRVPRHQRVKVELPPEPQPGWGMTPHLALNPYRGA
jgi:hypothetical protein